MQVIRKDDGTTSGDNPSRGDAIGVFFGFFGSPRGDNPIEG